MFSKNILFSVLKNRKQKTIFGCQIYFFVFLFKRTENSSRKQLPNRLLLFQLPHHFQLDHLASPPLWSFNLFGLLVLTIFIFLIFNLFIYFFSC